MTNLFQHTAARRRLAVRNSDGLCLVSFNTQPPEGGCCCKSFPLHFVIVSTHSRPKAAGGNPSVGHTSAVSFQHTAARRRLLLQILSVAFRNRFNTQPPEGGCICVYFPSRDNGSFNTQPPEGGCRIKAALRICRTRFNTQPPEGGCRWRDWHYRRWSVSTHSRPKAADSIFFALHK